MHVGNVLNALLNALYAKQKGGVFYFCPEGELDLKGETQINRMFLMNLRLANKLSLMGNCCMPILMSNLGVLQKHYFNSVMESSGIPPWTYDNGGRTEFDNVECDIKTFHTGIPMNVFNDAILGITTFIRGREFVESTVISIDELKRNSYYSEICKRMGKDHEVEYIYHPMITCNGEPISKSKSKDGNMATMYAGNYSGVCDSCGSYAAAPDGGCNIRDKADNPLGFGELCFSSVIMFFLEHFVGREIVSVEDAEEVSESIDLRVVFKMDDIEYSDESILNVYNRLIKMPYFSSNNVDRLHVQNLEFCRRIMFNKVGGTK
jgi:hypothetical protein